MHRTGSTTRAGGVEAQASSCRGQVSSLLLGPGACLHGLRYTRRRLTLSLRSRLRTNADPTDRCEVVNLSKRAMWVAMIWQMLMITLMRPKPFLLRSGNS